MKILIAGDSWGSGVWMPLKNGCIVVHKGMQEFLTSYGHTVDNISEPGIGNTRIHSLLTCKDLTQYDYVFVFFANPFRDVNKTVKSRYFDVPNRSFSYTDLEGLYNDLVVKYFETLEKFNHPLYLLGNSKVDESLLKSEKVKCLIPSIREKLYPGWTQEKLVFSSKIFEDVIEKFDVECVEQIYKIWETWLNYPNIQKEYFAPDGYHLNMEGHKWLADYLHEFITFNSNK